MLRARAELINEFYFTDTPVPEYISPSGYLLKPDPPSVGIFQFIVSTTYYWYTYPYDEGTFGAGEWYFSLDYFGGGTLEVWIHMVSINGTEKALLAHGSADLPYSPSWVTTEVGPFLQTEDVPNTFGDRISVTIHCMLGAVNLDLNSGGCNNPEREPLMDIDPPEIGITVDPVNPNGKVGWYKYIPDAKYIWNRPIVTFWADDEVIKKNGVGVQVLHCWIYYWDISSIEWVLVEEKETREPEPGWWYPVTHVFPVPKDGMWKFECEAWDFNYNVAGPIEKVIKVDSTEPIAEILGPDQVDIGEIATFNGFGSYDPIPSYKFILGPPSGLGPYKWYLDGGFKPPEGDGLPGDHDFGPFNEVGEHRIELRIWDVASNDGSGTALVRATFFVIPEFPVIGTLDTLVAAYIALLIKGKFSRVKLSRSKRREEDQTSSPIFPFSTRNKWSTILWRF